MHVAILGRVADGLLGLTLGGTVQGDPVKEIVKTAFDHGINFIDTAEGVSELSRFAGDLTAVSRRLRRWSIRGRDVSRSRQRLLLRY